MEPVAKVDTESLTYCQGADYFERSEACDEHRELERCLWEQVKYMENDSDDSTALDGVEIDDDDHIEGFWGKLANTGADDRGDAPSMSEWLQFKHSAQGVDRYMETVTAEIQEVSKHFHISSSEECKALSSNPVGYGEKGPHAQEERDKLSNTAAEPAVTQRILHSAKQGVNARDSPIFVGLPAGENDSKTMETRDATVALSIKTIDCVGPAQKYVSSLGDLSGETCTGGSCSTIACEEHFPPFTDRYTPNSLVQESKSEHPVAAEQIALVMDGVCGNRQTISTTATIETDFVDRHHFRELEMALEQQLEEMYRGNDCRKSGHANTAGVVESVGEAEVAQRIERTTEQALERRQRTREERCQRMMRDRSAMVLQAAWRGRRTRIAVTPTLAARQREAAERMFMFDEECATERVVALEADCNEMERRHRLEELRMMSDEEQRTRHTWAHLLWLQEMARQEELARMRAEERSVRALIEIELEEARRANMIRRAIEETAIMMSEDTACRKFLRLEKAVMAERAVMEMEDAASKRLEGMERQQQANTKVEVSHMRIEDVSSLTWNIGYRSAREATRRKAQSKSTPIQRAMDPRGVIAARRLVVDKFPCSSHSDTESGHDPATSQSQCADRSDARHLLILERARRRELYRSHLDSILAKGWDIRGRYNSKISTTVHRGRYQNDQQGNRPHLSTVREGKKQSYASASAQRTSRVGRDGTEYALTADMLSHLGPLQDLVGLELCVEGLTSVSLLQSCTSIKSLSLNVNRLSSTVDLTACKTLVRLCLRDNRLSSLEGLAGLPNLRNLRLDINHLTSLHELKALPSLVELSANTNHIRELPEGFASGLMTPLPQQGSYVSHPIKPSTSASELTLAPYALQKLELYHNRITVVHPRALDGLGSLTHLDLGRNQLKSLDGRGMEACPALSTLVLSQNGLQKPPSPLRLPLLTELWLSGNQISTMGEWAIGPPEDLTFPSLISRLEGAPWPERENLLPEDSETRKQGECVERSPVKGCADEGFVWLPSLVVLHLEDNALETLGGCWSLAGCPSLRSLDVSFNRLKALAGVGPCLVACGELEDVRLHDNPASEMCANTVMLNCSKLLRIDGVLVDRQAHWRAGVETYSGRSDVISPFFLQSAQVCGLHLDGGEAAALPPKDQEAVTNTTNKIQKRLFAKCPWCGAASGVPKNENSAVCRSQANDSCTNSQKEQGSECKWVALASMSPHMVEARQSLVKAAKVPQEPACGACGLVLPNTDLWLVSDAPDANPGVRWDDVLSSSHRWRCDLHTGYGVMKKNVDADNEESERADAFQKACRQGYHERAQMRHRHRREVRDIVSTASVFGEATRPTRTEGGGGAHSASASPSTRKLELEIELGEKHARERRELTVRLLRLHGSDGIGHVSIYNGENEHCVVMDYQSPVTSRAVSATAGSQENKSETESASNPSLWQSRAALGIQNLWRRCQGRAKTPSESSSQPDLDSDMTEPANEKAATTLQSAFRGFHVRRMLQAALDSAKYIDDELEGLLNANGGTHFKLDRFLSPPPELAEEWMGDGAATQLSNKGSVSEKVVAARAQVVAAARTVACSTPRQNNKAICQTDDTQEAGHISSYKGVDSARSHKQEAGGVRASTNHVVKTGATGFLEETTGRELVLAPSRDAEVTAGGIRKSGTVGARLAENDKIRNKNCNGHNGPGQVHVVREAVENDLIKAWGLKDPNVAGMMMKRMKRLRKFQNSEARREKMRNPEARYEVFARKVGEHRRAHPMIEPFDSNQTRQLGTHRSGASDVGLGHESRGVGLQLPPILTAWAGRGRASGASLSTKISRPNHNTTRHIRKVRGSPDSEQASAARPPSTSSSCAARPSPLPSETFPLAAEGLRERR